MTRGTPNPRGGATLKSWKMPDSSKYHGEMLGSIPNAAEWVLSIQTRDSEKDHREPPYPCKTLQKEVKLKHV